MTSTCMSESINDITRTTPVRRRPPYVRFHSLPECSDRGFSLSRAAAGYNKTRPRIVDSVSCRQIYLRSYTFSRKESVREKTKKCLGKVKQRVVLRSSGSRKSLRKGSMASSSSSSSKQVSHPSEGRKCLTKLKKVSRAALLSMFRRLMSCTTTVDVSDYHGDYY